MRKDHPEFFKDLKLDEYSVQSTGRERTVESSLARMSGIFDIFNTLGTKDADFDPESVLQLQDIVMKNPPSTYDPINRFSGFSECRDFVKHHTKDTVKIKQGLYDGSSKIQKFAKEIQVKLGWEKTPTWIQLAMMGDEAISDVYSTKDPVFDHDSEEFQKLKWINSANHYSKFYDMNYNKLYASPLLREVAANILSKYRSHLNLIEEPFPLKFKLCSAHDTTISPILINLGIVDRSCIMN